jgi:hypothetical protein
MIAKFLHLYFCRMMTTPITSISEKINEETCPSIHSHCNPNCLIKNILENMSISFSDQNMKILPTLIQFAERQLDINDTLLIKLSNKFIEKKLSPSYCDIVRQASDRKQAMILYGKIVLKISSKMNECWCYGFNKIFCYDIQQIITSYTYCICEVLNKYCFCAMINSLDCWNKNKQNYKYFDFYYEYHAYREISFNLQIDWKIVCCKYLYISETILKNIWI